MSTVEETVSSLSAQIQRAGTQLRNEATDQIHGYESRFQTIGRLHERLFRNMIVTNSNVDRTYETAKSLFGTDTITFAAVDGTEYARPLFDLIVFFGGSYVAKGTISYRREGLPIVDYENHFLKEGRALSSCVPVFVNEVPDVDRNLVQQGVGNGMTVRPLTDEAIANNSTIPAWIMTFSEFYLAYRLASEKNPPQLIFLDRSLSSTFPNLIYDSAARKLWISNGALHGCEVDGTPLDTNDLAFGRFHLFLPDLDIPPARGDYLRYRILLELERNGPMSARSLFGRLETNNDLERQGRVEKYLQKSVRDKFLDVVDGVYSLTPRYRTTWPRIRSLVEAIGRRMFEDKPNANPMKISKNGEWHWLTTQDMAFLTLFTLNMLAEECFKRKILLVGLAKDTAARDLKNHVIPVLLANKVWNSEITQEELSRLPNTDRMLLQSLSIFSHDLMPVPWSTIEYDGAFLSIVPDYDHRPGYVSGATRNKITPERLFAKSYIQLSQASYDPQLRSNVLLTDRLACPGYDSQKGSMVEFSHTYGGADEPLRPILYRDKNLTNPIQELVMTTLSSMTSNSVPELFGHNKPLFIADKVAKWHNQEMRRVIDTTGKWLMNNPSMRRFVFYMSTFRERRTEIESNRRDNF